jgi:hypothetical protein
MLMKTTRWLLILYLNLGEELRRKRRMGRMKEGRRMGDLKKRMMTVRQWLGLMNEKKTGKLKMMKDL